ncbi:MAG: 7-cyano-7-deazaguanine synthase QueC [Clostridium sp.]|nr:7-cyano-7-deazaguanine synthase QueC [Clostridium sp.]
MKISTKKTGVILLSGGLDSVVSLAFLQDEIDFKLALTFDYGQKSFQKELEASKNIAKYFKIEHKCIKLDWLQKITKTSLVSKESIPDITEKNLDNEDITIQSMKNVWVPNRNGLFINIAASFADSFGYDYIVIGANKEEAATFSDNSKAFIKKINRSLEYSTNYKTKVIAPLIDMKKNEIVKKAVELKAPLKFINSCYNNTKKHCGRCESCNRLKRALKNINQEEILKELFED